MLLDATGVLLGIGLAVAGFLVVVMVTALVLRLIGVVLGDGDAGDAAGADAAAGGEEDAEAPAAGDGARSEPDPG